MGCENSPLRLRDFSHLLSLWQRYLFKSLLDTCTTFGDGARRSAVLANSLAHIAVMWPDPQSGAMRDLVAKLLDFDDVNHFIGEMTSGLSTRYDLGSELDDVGRLIGDQAIRHGKPDSLTYKVMQDGMGVLLDACHYRKPRLQRFAVSRSS